MTGRLSRQPELWTTVGAVLALTVGHYAAPTQDPFWHDLFRRLYYLPVVLAGFRYGFRGGLLTAGLVSVLFLPHVLMTQQALAHQAREAVFEVPLYLLVGVATGFLSDRQRRAAASLYRAERLKTVGELAAGMAHEVKNPLAAIRSAAQMLERRTGEKDAELARIVVSEVDRLNRVVNDFLSYARPAPLRRGPVRLSQVVQSCIELLGPVVSGRAVGISQAWPPDEAELNGDAHQLRQVFLNLLLNAAQAVGESGRIAVAAEQRARETRVTVQDSGHGIDSDQLKRVFEPFYSTRPGGTGLGLAIARRIVVEHGGRLVLESTPGQGTKATVVLPRKEG